MFLVVTQITLFIFAILAVVVPYLIGASRKRRPQDERDEIVFVVNSSLLLTMWSISVLAPLCLAIATFFTDMSNERAVIAVLCMGAFFTVVGMMMTVWSLCRKTGIGPEGLTSYYIFAQPRFLPWEEVRKVTFASGQEFWVRGQKGHKAMLHVWFVGVNQSLHYLHMYLPEEVKKSDVLVLNRFSATVGSRVHDTNCARRSKKAERSGIAVRTP